MRTLPLLLSLVAGASAGTVSARVNKKKLDIPSSLHKRDGTLNLDGFNNISGGGYYAKFDVGTPPQELSFLLDTGSSDTWVNSDDTDLCNDPELQASIGSCYATFNPDDSSTYKVLDRNGFDIKYLDSRRIEGDYFEDTVTIDGKKIKKQQLGLAVTSVRPTGIMGLGFSANVAAEKPYPAIVDTMVSQGLIERAAFSLWLNDLSADDGNILFGGIDKSKFVGKLATLPLVASASSLDGNVTSFAVNIRNMEVTIPSGQTKLSLESLGSGAVAILDSGSTISLIPDSQVEDIYDRFDILSLGSSAVPLVDCAYADKKGDGISFEFEFKDKTISVPMDEMVINAFADQQSAFEDPRLDQYFGDWDGVCMFGLSAASNYGVSPKGFFLLGDTFLRSAYVVYDLANEQLGIAEANPGSSKSDIVELNADDKDFPDIQGVASKSTFSPTDASSTTGSRQTVTVTAGSDASSGKSGDDDDSAAGHLVPALMAMLMMGLGALITVL
ncbi:Peptidase A1 domain-containing protein [Fusarium sp. LHS14.1]|nr:Peptidase A1 domain-containing protein [Fusarium sp. LHS14.1]